MNERAATTGEVALAALREHVGHVQARAAGARSGEQSRDVHQMRVATRRLRALLRVFEDVLPEDAAQLNDELRWLAGLLGAVRDLDVQLTHASKQSEKLGLSHDLQPYCAWLQVERERARQALVCALDGQRYASLTSELRRAASQWQATQDVPIHPDAAKRLRQVAKKLWRTADKLTPSSAAADLHRARIKAKRLRYAVEFYVPVFGSVADEVARRAVDVQDVLGEHQDTVVAADRVATAVEAAHGTWSARTAFALGVLVHADADRAARIRAEFPDADRRLRKAWKRLRTELERG